MEGATRVSRIVKQQRRYGSEWYLENDEGEIAWVAPMVKEHIERLEAENEKLRKELELVGHIAVSNVAASIGREESLEDENAKLREFLQDTLMDADDYAKKYGISPSFTDITEHLDTRMRELGIEG